MYSGHDRFVKFNRRGGANKQRGGGKIILKLIDGGARLLETPEYIKIPDPNIFHRTGCRWHTHAVLPCK